MLTLPFKYALGAIVTKLQSIIKLLVSVLHNCLESSFSVITSKLHHIRTLNTQNVSLHLVAQSRGFEHFGCPSEIGKVLNVHYFIQTTWTCPPFKRYTLCTNSHLITS